MKDKISQVCDYILDRLESGEYKTGEAIPAARKTAQEVDASFAMIQHAVATLVQAGILRSVSRQGSTVREGWQNCLLPSNLVLFEPDRPWVPGFAELLKQELPDLRLSPGFKRGMFELRTTLHVQQYRNEYLDLAPYFREIHGDGGEFFQTPFRGFRNADGSIYGIPFIFSPRVMFCNPEMLAKAGIPLPPPEWTFDDFLAVITKLKAVYPPENILNYSYAVYFWSSFIFRCGGRLIDPAAEDPVQLDSPATMRGVETIRRLKRTLGPNIRHDNYMNFVEGKLAFALSEREMLCQLKHSGNRNWQVLPLPHIPGGTAAMAQATDLLCVRKECVNSDLILEFLRFMLSEKVQDYIAEEKYGIPIRKTSAQKSIDLSDPRDRLFLTEMDAMTAEYELGFPELTTLVQTGVGYIIENDSLSLSQALPELANAIRLFLNIRKNAPE